MSEFEDFDNPMDDDGEPQSMSLMGGIAGGGALPGSDEFGLHDGNDSKRVTQQSFLIGLIVVVVAFGALMAMRMTQKDLTASAASDETRQFMDNLDARLANLDKMDKNDPLTPDNIRKMFEDTADIVAAIENDPTKNQVPLAQVQMNPFTPINAKKTEVVEDNTAKLEAERKKQLRQYQIEMNNIKLQSLIGGTRPRAIVDGEIYKVGDKLGSFEIVLIDNRKVIFNVPNFPLRTGEPPFVIGMKRDK